MKIIQKSEDKLAYIRFGTGDKILLAFHGFGQNKEIFKPWESAIGHQYTVYAFDLFYHGASDRRHKKLSKQEWQDYLQQFLIEEQIDRFEVLGYSLGGRFAIAAAFSFSSKIDQLILIAPDGIHLTIWFKLATFPLLKSITKWFMVHPKRLDRLLALNRKIPLIDSYTVDFIQKELGSLENRKRVYMSWNNFKTLGYHVSDFIALMRRANFKKKIILGDNDKILPPKVLLPIIEKAGGFSIDRLPLKHHQLIQKEVANLLIDQNS